MTKVSILARDVEGEVFVAVNELMVGCDYKDKDMLFDMSQEFHLVMRDKGGNLVWFDNVVHPLQETERAPGLFGWYLHQYVNAKTPFSDWLFTNDELTGEGAEDGCDEHFNFVLDKVPEEIQRFDFILADVSHNESNPKVRWVGSLIRREGGWVYVNTRTWTTWWRFSKFVGSQVEF